MSVTKLASVSGVKRNEALDRTQEVSRSEELDFVEFEPQETNATLPTFDHTRIAAAPEYTQSGYAEVVQILASPLDMSVTKQREGFNKKMLNYLDGKYVIQTLNRIFGYGCWGYHAIEVKDMALDSETNIPMAVSAVVELWVQFPGGPRTSFTDTGFGENVQPSFWDSEARRRVFKPRTWAGYEMARKGAVTDALKRAAANLGDQFGLSLKGSDGDAVATIAPTSDTSTTAAPAAPTAGGSHTPTATDTHFECEECGKEIKGYTSKAGKFYSAADMAKFSIRDTEKVLCYDHKQEWLNANKR